MRICVFADTHAHSLDVLPSRLRDELSSSDLVIHAGDYTGRSLLESLQQLRQFKGVFGNLDPYEVRQALPATIVVEVEGFRIGVAHPAEGGPPWGIERRVLAKFRGVHAIIYGHTHEPKCEWTGGILHLNPGSGTGAWPASRKTFGVLAVGKQLEGSIVSL